MPSVTLWSHWLNVILIECHLCHPNDFDSIYKRLRHRNETRTNPIAFNCIDRNWLSIGGGSTGNPGMFLRTGGHVTKFAAWRFFLVTRVTPQRVWVAAWRFWAVTWVTNSLQFTIPMYVGRPYMIVPFWAHRKPFSCYTSERTDAIRRRAIT